MTAINASSDVIMSENTAQIAQFTNIFIGLLISMVILCFVFYIWNAVEGYLLKAKCNINHKPNKYPDKLKIKKSKKGYYVIKNKKRKYLSKEELKKMYNNYIRPLKMRLNAYPTRTIQL